MQQAREERFVRIELAADAREHVRQRGGMNAVPPYGADVVAKLTTAVADEHLLRGERQRDVAYHPIAELRDSVVQARDRRTTAKEQRAIRYFQDPRSQRGVGAEQAHDLAERHILVGERTPDL